MLASLLIGLREGLEAALIVAILVAYLVKRDMRSRVVRVWVGVAAAVATSFGLAGLLALTSSELSETAEKNFAGVTSIAAAGLITWLTFWMAQHARHLRAELHQKMDQALLGNSLALAGVAFFAVLREGLETAVFMVSAVQVSGSFSASFLGLVAGLAISILVGYLVYKGVLRVNLGKVFTVVGSLLIVVAAGVLTYGIHEFHESGVISFGTSTVIDTTSFIDPTGLIGSLLRGLLAYRGVVSQLELVVWTSFVAITATLYARKLRQPAEQKTPAAVG